MTGLPPNLYLFPDDLVERLKETARQARQLDTLTREQYEEVMRDIDAWAIAMLQRRPIR